MFLNLQMLLGLLILLGLHNAEVTFNYSVEIITTPEMTRNISEVVTTPTTVELTEKFVNLTIPFSYATQKKVTRSMFSEYYCSLCCISLSTGILGKSCGEHTMCRYPERKPGPACHGYITVRFSQIEKLALLRAHNKMRSHVANGRETRGRPGPQPSAANMRMMVWNDELETFADRWAMQCIFSHDLCRDSERFPVGQNMARGSFARMNDTSYIYSWYAEVDDFDSSNIEFYNISHATTHYSQIIWAETYQLGCSRALFQILNNNELIYRQHLVCNYGPSGNVPGHPVYEIGPPCSACPIGTECKVDPPGLCGYVDHNFMNALVVTTAHTLPQEYIMPVLLNNMVHPIKIPLILMNILLLCTYICNQICQ